MSAAIENSRMRISPFPYASALPCFVKVAKMRTVVLLNLLKCGPVFFVKVVPLKCIFLPSNPFSLYGDYPLKSAEGRFRLVPIRNPAVPQTAQLYGISHFGLF